MHVLVLEGATHGDSGLESSLSKFLKMAPKTERIIMRKKTMGHVCFEVPFYIA
jgi:hypothetical protein